LPEEKKEETSLIYCTISFMYPHTFDQMIEYAKLHDSNADTELKEKTKFSNEDRFIHHFTKYNVPSWAKTFLRSLTVPHLFQLYQAAEYMKYHHLILNIIKTIVADLSFGEEADAFIEKFRPWKYNTSYKEFIP
jgi:hypothetical protein